MQGVMKADCKVDVQEHFKLPNKRAEALAQEKAEHEEKMAALASTSEGMVRRLI